MNWHGGKKGDTDTSAAKSAQMKCFPNAKDGSSAIVFSSEKTW